MTFDELFDSLPNNGWLKRDEAQLLLEAARETEGPILEVGCYYGRSTVLLASLGRDVYCVDPFEKFDSDDPSGRETLRQFMKNITDRKLHNVTLRVQYIEDWESKPMGFAYLDGDHTTKGTLAQIDAAMACGAEKMCIHDYAHSGGGLLVKKAVEQSDLVLVDLVETMALCTRSK